MAYMVEEYEEVNEEEDGAEEEEDFDGGDDDEEVVLGDTSRGKGSGASFQRGRKNYADGDSDVDDEKLDRDQQLLQETCLPVSGPPMCPDEGAPKDADEYLRQVQWERMHCPEVVDVEVADMPAKRNRRRQGDGLLARLEQSSAFEEESCRCSPEWAEDVATAFHALRSSCDAARMAAVEQGLGTPGKSTIAAWRERCAAGRPSSDTLARFDFIGLNRLITVSVEALVEFQEEAASMQAGGQAQTAETPEVHTDEVPSLPEQQAPAAAALDLERLDALTEWVFAALAYVELPLLEEVQFQMQRLRRTCHRLAALAKTMPGGDESVGAVRANLLLVVVTRVFGQR